MRDGCTRLSFTSSRRSILSHLRSILLNVLLYFITYAVEFPNESTNCEIRKFGRHKKKDAGFHKQAPPVGGVKNRSGYFFLAARAIALISMSARRSMLAYTAADRVFGSNVMWKCVMMKANSLS